MKFSVEGDLILYEGVPIARFEPTLWPTLRDRIEMELECAGDYDRDVQKAYDEGYEEGERAFGKDE